ncbi:MAG: TIGR04086 family membrane protein [Acutalibacteraceae bacterium]
MRNDKTLRHENNVSRYIKSIIWGTLFGSIFSALLLFAVTALLAKTGFISENVINVLTLMISCLGVLFGSFVGARISKEKGLLIGMFVGLFMFIILLVVSFLIIREPISKLSLTKSLIMIITGAIGGIIGVNKRAKV